MDACWSNRTKHVQITEVVLSEIYEVLEAPDEDYLPPGISRNMRAAIKNASPEDAENIRKQLLEMPHQRKRTKILELFELLKQYIETERLVDVAVELNKVMKQKLVVSGEVSAEKSTEKQQEKVDVR